MKFFLRIFNNHKKNIFISTIFINVISLIFLYGFTSWTSKLLSPHDYGFLNLFITASKVLAIVAGLSVGISLLHEVGKRKYSEKETVLNVWIIYSGLSILAVLITVIGSLFYNLLSSDIVLLILTVVFSLIYQANVELKHAHNKITELNILRNIKYIVLFLLLCTVFVIDIINLHNLLIVYTVASFLAMFFSFFSFRKYNISEFKINYTFIKLCIKNGLIVHMGIIATMLLARIDQLMIASYLNIEQLGIYSVAVNISEYLFLIVSLVNLILYPKNAHDTLEGAIKNTKKYSSAVFTIVCFLGIILLIGTKFILLIYSNEQYIAAIWPLRILIVGTVFYTISMVLSTLWVHKGWFKYITIVSVSMAILNIILNIILIPYYGINGAAIATAIAYILHLTMYVFIFYKYIDKNIKDLFIIKKEAFLGIYNGFPFTMRSLPHTIRRVSDKGEKLNAFSNSNRSRRK